MIYYCFYYFIYPYKKSQWKELLEIISKKKIGEQENVREVLADSLESIC